MPVDSDRPQIEEFINRNFTGVVFVVSSTDDSRALAHPKTPHVFIRAVDLRGFPGGSRVEIYLLLTREQRLKDVIVKAFDVRI